MGNSACTTRPSPAFAPLLRRHHLFSGLACCSARLRFAQRHKLIPVNNSKGNGGDLLLFTSSVVIDATNLFSQSEDKGNLGLGLLQVVGVTIEVYY